MIPHRIALLFTGLVLSLLASLSMAAPAVTPAGSVAMDFSGGSGLTAPQWEMGKNQVLDFTLPGLTIHDLQVGSQTWQTLGIEDSVVHGEKGEPGLPVLSRLVAVPAGMTLEATIISSSSQNLANLKLVPVQDPASDSFAFNAAAYSGQGYQRRDQPVVQVGKPAITAGQTVVPLMIHPVNYDPSAEQAVVWNEIQLRLEFVPDREATSTQARTSPLAPSFYKQFSQQVLGFDHLVTAGGREGDLQYSGLGTYVAVHNGNSQVMAEIEPLLEWRRQQGYRVVEVNTALVGNTNTAIKNELQSLYNDELYAPLEFVTIFGDASGAVFVPSYTEGLSGYGGGGDHYYSMLEGEDILSDVHVSRVSVLNVSQLSTVVNKIINYENSPPVDDTSWFGRALLQGDPSSSGITTIYTNQWIKSQLLELGWTQVDTTWSGNFPSQMVSAVTPGVSVYGYRGYLGTSGISNAHVESLSNGGRLPIALLPTCDSGSFVGSSTCRSEAWLRSANGGAVAAVGTATIGTHTRYNNCYYLGTWDDLLNGEDHRIGVAHTAGKLALYRGYYQAEPYIAEIWAVWNNVMGDGATEMWTGVPRNLAVTHPSQVSLGAQAIALSVTESGFARAGARVSLYQASSGWQGSALTDASGQVMINIPALDPGSVTITVTGHNLLPYQSGFSVGQVNVFCGATGSSVLSGGDAFLNPGESANFTVLLTNQGISDAFGVTAEVSVLSGPASMVGSSLSFGTIASGLEVASASPAQLGISDQAEAGDLIQLLITATNGSEVWTSILEETVQAASFRVAALNLDSFGGSIDPGESGVLEIILENSGSLDATAVSAILLCDSPWVVLGDDSANFGDLAPGETGVDLISPFNLTASTDGFGGHLASFTLQVSYNNGWQTTVQFAAPIGTATADQPTGPDAYGYYAFDNGDDSAFGAPVYDWVGIDPDHGGQGTDLDLADYGWEQDDTKVMDLPFEFGFYGEDYNRVSICSNGWIAMGESQVNFYRNFPFPGPHTADAMIAPFWDNLNQSGNKKVYTWYDEAGHRFIIQWYDMPNHFSGAVQNFEVILLDPSFHPTSTGDGMILFQYEQVSNTDTRDGYATVGIQNRDRSIGLNYTYWNQYAPGASPLAAGRAILFKPIGDILAPAIAVTPASISQSVAPGNQVTEYLHISNQGDEGSVLDVLLSIAGPEIVSNNKALEFQDDPTVEPSSLSGSHVTTSVTSYEPGQTIDLPFEVYCSSSDDEYIMLVEIDAPLGVTVNSATNLTGPIRTLYWNDETGNGVQTSWGQLESVNHLRDTHTGYATLNLTFSSEVTGPVELPWTVYGDNWGDAPHFVSGTMVIETTNSQISVGSPIIGQIAEVGSDLAVEFMAFNGPQLVNIDLQREPDGLWVSLATDVPATDSPWIWTVTGEPGPYAVIRVSDAADSAVFGVSGVFSINANLDWLSLTTNSGEVLQGQTMDFDLTLDATNLLPGLFEAQILVNSNGGLTQVIPVTMNVTSTSAAFGLPNVVTLMGNYPNPFNPQTLINFSLPTDQQVRLNVYSVNGRLVRSLLNGAQPAGVHRVVWDGKNNQGQSSASGVYFYRLNAGAEVFTGKMVMTK